MTFGEKLKQARENCGLTRKDMAEHLNLTIAAYSNYENDQRLPNMDTLRELCVRLCVSSDEILEINTNAGRCFTVLYQAMAERNYRFLHTDPIDLFRRRTLNNYPYRTPPSGYEYVSEIPNWIKTNAMSLNHECYFYFAKPGSKYDYIPILGEDCIKMGKCIQADNSHTSDTKLDDYIEDFRQGGPTFEKWQKNILPLYRKYSKFFLRYYDNNSLLAKDFLKKNGYDEESSDIFNTRDFKYLKLRVTFSLIKYDVRDLRKELTKTYIPSKGR